jgi:hypothetical protein
MNLATHNITHLADFTMLGRDVVEGLCHLGSWRSVECTAY